MSLYTLHMHITFREYLNFLVHFLNFLNLFMYIADSVIDARNEIPLSFEKE